MFKVIRTINKNPERTVKEFEDKEDAKAYAKRLRSGLSRGEKAYYKLSYVVR